MGEKRITARAIGLGVLGVLLASGLGWFSYATSAVELVEPEADAAVLIADPEGVAQGRPGRRSKVIPPAQRGSTASGATVAVSSDTSSVPPIMKAAVSDDAEALQRGYFRPVSVDVDIRAIDFYNDFEYEMNDEWLVTVTDGHFRSGVEGTDEYRELIVDGVMYGDLTSDGREDAVVLMRVGDSLRELAPTHMVFSINDGTLDYWGSSWWAYYLPDSIIDVVIQHGQLQVLSLSRDRSVIGQTSWRFWRAGGSVERLDRTGARSWLELSLEPAGPALDIGLQNGALRARISAQENRRAFVFAAEAGWSLKLTDIEGDAIVRIREEATGQLVGDVNGDKPLALGSAGRFVGQVLSTSSDAVVFDLDASDLRTLQAPRWQPLSEVRVTEIGTTDWPVRQEQSFSWPEFTWAAGAADLSAVNDTIRSFVDERLQRHAERVGMCSDGKGSVHNLSFDVTLASYDLVSIDFDEFIGICDNDFSATRSLIIDMNTGEALSPIDVFLPFDPESGARWIDQVRVQESDWNFERVEFWSLSLNPDGLVTSTLWLQPGSESDATDFAMSFGHIGGLVKPSIVTRAASGASTQLPWFRAASVPG